MCWTIFLHTFHKDGIHGLQTVPCGACRIVEKKVASERMMALEVLMILLSSSLSSLVTVKDCGNQIIAANIKWLRRLTMSWPGSYI